MLFFILACLSEKQDSGTQDLTPKDPWVLEKTKQREGDAAVGYDYLLYGGYIGSGIPKEIFYQFFGTSSNNLLQREGESANIPPIRQTDDGLIEIIEERAHNMSSRERMQLEREIVESNKAIEQGLLKIGPNFEVIYDKR